MPDQYPETEDSRIQAVLVISTVWEIELTYYIDDFEVTIEPR